MGARPAKQNQEASGASSTGEGASSTDLKEDLITYYRDNESQIPAVPLVEENSVALEDLYVIPPMWAHEKSHEFEPVNKTQKKHQKPDGDDPKRHRATVSQLFSDKSRYRKIYISANAGFGKTSLSQKLTLTWCQSHSPLEQLKTKYEDEELNAMKYFDLLFMLHLRDFHKCNIDDLITEMVSDKLPRNAQYTKEFLQRNLNEKQCLIIFDGLDEWAHPRQCNRRPRVPHNKYSNTCTVLITTRDWKIGTLELSPKDIDRRVEIAELDDKTRDMLKINAIRILNDRTLNRAGKSIEDFDEEVKSLQIDGIMYTPYILLQLICLFFDGLPIGKSKCEIYSNITEFTLERAVKTKNLPDSDAKSKENATIPNCMKNNETCNRYKNLIMKLGKLAFFTLLGKEKESSLIFDGAIIKKYMDAQEIDLCLKVGLLCQTKDSTKIAVKRYKACFQHRSVHEFFSAIYITSEWENEHVKSTLMAICSSISGILEMENLFTFVCGMNSEVYTRISAKLQNIVDNDSKTRRYKTDMNCNDDDIRIMKSYQSMQVQCVQESLRNGNDSCSVVLHDILLDKNSRTEELIALNKIINFNKGNLKSLQLSFPDEKILDFMRSLDCSVFNSLETLRVERCVKVIDWLGEILNSARKLKCLTLSLGPYSFLSDIMIKALAELKYLESLYLRAVTMTHSNLEDLYHVISQSTGLTQLKLEDIDCSDHSLQNRDCYCHVTLNLDFLKKLESVELVMIRMSYNAWQQLFLNVGQFSGSIIFKLSYIKMTSEEWRELLHSVSGLRRSVTVKLSECHGPSQKEWTANVNTIKSTPKLSLRECSIGSDGYASLTLKNETV